jgi:hypothetical protein
VEPVVLAVLVVRLLVLVAVVWLLGREALRARRRRRRLLRESDRVAAGAAERGAEESP